MKVFCIFFLSLFLASCFGEQSEKTQTIVSKENSELIELSIPSHEKTTEIEAEFSQDLEELLKLIDETPNEE